MEKTLENRIKLFFNHYNKPVEFNLLVGDKIERRRGILKGVMDDGEVKVQYLDTHIFFLEIEEDEVIMIKRSLKQLTDNELVKIAELYFEDLTQCEDRKQLGEYVVNKINDNTLFKSSVHTISVIKVCQYLNDINLLMGDYNFTTDDLLRFNWIEVDNRQLVEELTEQN